jgi:hypothetical protein
LSFLASQCDCTTFERDRLIKTKQVYAEVGSLWKNLADTHPHLFAATPAFISSDTL